MLKDFRIGNPHDLDYCLPVNPPKALYTPPRERRSALQQALDAAGDAFTTGRSRMDWSVKSLPSGDFEVVQAEQPVERREFRVGDRVVAPRDCEPWYANGDRGAVDLIDTDGSIRVAFVPSHTVAVVGCSRSWWSFPDGLRHEGAAL